MNIQMPVWNLGAVIAVVVLVLALVLLIIGHNPTKELIYGMVAALAVARLT